MLPTPPPSAGPASPLNRSPSTAPPAGIQERVTLAPLTTIGIGGPARWFLSARSRGEVRQALEWAAAEGIALFVLGGGSNLLIADEGFPGLVLRVALRGVEQEGAGGGVLLRAAAGEDWDPLVARSVEAGLAGLECLSGIPGAAGATPIQNVGAYGQEVAETLVEVEAMSRADGTLRRFSAAECAFGYRQSVFKGAERDRWVVLSVTYRLTPGGEPAVRYPELQRFLAGQGEGSDLQKVRNAVISLRRRKGMVLDPEDADTRSDGSFFVNPVLAPDQVESFLARVAATGIAADQVPRFPVEGGVKLSAAWLIERAGFAKGHRHGNVGLSGKHALAIVNRGGGTAAEVRGLVAAIREAVAVKFGVRLEPEPIFVGPVPAD
jgi:UDP-N-acetylmuramate dehydrogenase